MGVFDNKMNALVKKIKNLFSKLTPKILSKVLLILNTPYGYDPGKPRIVLCSVCGVPIPRDIKPDKDGSHWCSWCDQSSDNPTC